MKQLLIVSPHFAPVNAPDMQRVRMALPFLDELGWSATVLAVAPDLVEGAVIEPLLEHTYPSQTRVIRVRGISPKVTRWLGVGNLWWRCGRALRRAGDALLAREKFDLVFFSTTQFDSFTLGPRWRRRFGVPFVLDYQDPWVNDYYRETHTRPPGGSFKFWLSQYTARRSEGAVLKSASSIVAVSAAYGPALGRRYPWLTPHLVKTIPFGASRTDLELARRHPPRHCLVPFGDGRIHHVYTGRCGPDMTMALTNLFRAFAEFRQTHPTEARAHHFHFIGTDYAPPPLGRFWALPIAGQEGVREHVSEHCYRVPYFEALHYLTRADALIVLGSNDPTYSASKIFPNLFAGRPLLTIAHKESAMLTFARGQGHRCSYGFGADGDPPGSMAPQIRQEWFVEQGFARLAPGAPEKLDAHTAKTMTRELTDLFDEALTRPCN